MKANIRISIALMSIVALFCLSGCSKSEKDISNDIANVDSYFTLYDLQLTDYEITKRQTNNSEKTDFVWIEISGENDDFSYDAAYTATYIKYNDGWHLEDYTLEKSDYSALNEPSLDLVKDNLSKDYADLEVVQNTGRPGSNKKSYVLSGSIRDNYIIRTYEISTNYAFSPKTGWHKESEDDSISAVQYDIVGEWLFEDSEHIYYIHISDATDDKVTFKYSFLNKNINPDDGYWQLRQSDYETYTIGLLHDIDYLRENTCYFDVGWKKTYNTVSFADEDYIWFCNHVSTVHGTADTGFVVNGHFLENISKSNTDSNYPPELRNAEEQYTVDYSTIPQELFDSSIISYFDYLSRSYEDLESLITKTGVKEKYTLGKAAFIDNQVYVYLWIAPKPEATPSAISLEATGYSFTELREYFESELKWNIYEDSTYRFVVMIPNTDLQVTVQEGLFSTTVNIKKVQ